MFEGVRTLQKAYAILCGCIIQLILWMIYIKLYKDKPDNTIYHLLTYLSLSYIGIMRFTPCELTCIFLKL